MGEKGFIRIARLSELPESPKTPKLAIEKSEPRVGTMNLLSLRTDVVLRRKQINCSAVIGGSFQIKIRVGQRGLSKEFDQALRLLSFGF
jgi:hypothetical protein